MPERMNRASARGGSVDERDAAREFDHRFTRDFGGGMVGRLGEKTLEVLERGGETFEPVVERRAFEDFVNRARFQHQDAVERGECARPVGPAQVDSFQVTQHPRQDVARADRLEHRGLHLDLLSVDFGEAGANLVQVENGPAVERVDDEFAAIVGRFDQKMMRKGDTEQVQAKAAADFDIDQRKCDGKAEAAFEHVVQKGVARVAEILAIAGEAFALEQELGEELNAFDRVGAAAYNRVGLARKFGQALEVLVDIEVGVFLFGDEQGSAGERNRLSCDNHREFAPRVVVHFGYPSIAYSLTDSLSGPSAQGIIRPTSTQRIIAASALSISSLTARSGSRLPIWSRARRECGPPRQPSAHAACARTSGSGSSASVRASTGIAAGFPLLPSTIAALRRSPRRLVRLIADLPKRRRKPSSSSAISSGSEGISSSHGGVAAAASSFHGQTSWQMSQQKIQLPSLGRSSAEIGPRCSIVR